jgi:orotidine-5'-phosphate decarboxylase
MPSLSVTLSEAVRRTGTPLCVGIDPWPERLPGSGGLPERAEAFGRAVVDACAGIVPAVKPQFAFFEALGPDGMRALARVCAHARAAGLVVVGDAKRGDIGSTARAYADATLAPGAPFPCDALTVNPFLGPDTVMPFLEAADAHGRGVFVLVRTSNPGSARWQAPVVDDLAAWLTLQGAARADARGLSNVGAVVGATHAAELAGLRERLPHAWLLVPGFGAQGATAADTRAAGRADGLGALVVSARAATFPDTGFGPDPADDVRTLVLRARDALARAWG